MDLIIYWTLIFNSKKDKVVKKTIDSMFLESNNTSILITKSEIYWKDKSKYIIELRQTIEFVSSIDFAIVKLFENMEKINPAWYLNIVSLLQHNFDVSATTDQLLNNDLFWVGLSSEIIF
jgi:hypothetical protein